MTSDNYGQKALRLLHQSIKLFWNKLCEKKFRIKKFIIQKREDILV